MQEVQRADYWLDDMLRHASGGETVDEFISDAALALSVSKDHARYGSIDFADVAEYAKLRVRYSEKNPVRQVMADALINHWMGV